MGNIVGSLSYITPRQEEILIGTLLGDGRLECRSKTGSARLRIHHGEKQKEFVFWKYLEFKNFVLSKPRRIKSGKVNTNNLYSWYFHTKTFSDFGIMHNKFYFEGKKVLPFNLQNLLTPLSLAVWYMDDGCLSRDSIILNTQNFSYVENMRIVEVLYNCFKISSGIHKDRDEYRIGIRKDSMDRFLSIVEPNVINSLKYKIKPRND